MNANSQELWTPVRLDRDGNVGSPLKDPWGRYCFKSLEKALDKARELYGEEDGAAYSSFGNFAQ